MKGKKFRIDKGTGKLVECQPGDVIPLLKSEVAGNVYLASCGPIQGLVASVDGSAAEQYKNLSAVLDKADQVAEKFDNKRDTLRVQEYIEGMRNEFL